ncbi:MAG: DUF3153 domain-containing protein [Chloroflexaceae bacterium]|nr:DUF3153 domain-containing protein [Chloroflexaceae bacterium]
MKARQQTRITPPKRAILVALALCLLTFLTGCVRYDVGVNFQGQYRGAITQQIILGKQLTNFSQTEAERWLGSLERRAQNLGGKTQRSGQELAVTIPFSSAQDLSDKFNRFFNPDVPTSQTQQPGDSLEVLQLNSHLDLTSNNFLLFERNHLHLSADLGALGVISEQGNLLISPGALVDIVFSLSTPLSIKTLSYPQLLPPIQASSRQLVWKLQPGQLNEIEAIFWLPSPIGIGAIAIILLVVFGYTFKYGVSGEKDAVESTV